MKEISTVKMFGGEQKRFSHPSSVCQCDMTFSVYLPPQAESGKPLPVLYWLSGLTCTDENFIQKAGAQQHAAEHGLILVAPDTSPRGEEVPDDAEGAWDFGLGAGFYVNATEQPWRKNYHMHDYVVKELPELIAANFQVTDKKSIFGHSMGGHGALTIALNNPSSYQSVSAFAPIVNPMNCPWGQKAFTHYLGEDQMTWRSHDTCWLITHANIAKEKRLPIKVDQGTADNFLQNQLHTERLQNACDLTGWPLTLQMQEGYDHSYFFIATFIGEHMRYHADYLTR